MTRDIQPSDDTDVQTAARNKIGNRIDRRRREETLEAEARIRRSIKRAEEAIAVVRGNDFSTLADVAEEADIGHSGLLKYRSNEDELGGCIKKDENDGTWKLTGLGERALEVDWARALDAVTKQR